jgi:cytochrome c oxidase subunit I
MIWTGQGGRADDVYIPLRADPLYYLGIILLRGGRAAGLLPVLRDARDREAREDVRGIAAADHVRCRDGGDHRGDHAAARRRDLHPDVPLVDRADDVDPQVYRMLWWALGHSSQQINVAAMVAIWYLLGALTVGAVVLNEKISRTAFVLYILFISMASAHHLLVDPGFSSSWKVVNTSYFMYMAVLASMLHGFTVPAGVEVGSGCGVSRRPVRLGEAGAVG